MTGRHRAPRAQHRPRILITTLAALTMFATLAATPGASAAPGPIDSSQRHHHHDVAGVPPDCTLTVPADPTSAQGLATPYLLKSDGTTCTEGSPDTSAFVEATIVDPATGALSVYRPLVIDDGSTPLADPIVPTLPAGAVVGIWFGFQGDTMKLTGPGAHECVNGLGASLFGQVAYCNAREFFDATRGVVHPPALGTALDGLPCPTTRDFSVVDQDQSDNVSTQYIVTSAGVGPSTVATRALPGAEPLKNGSDEGLLDRAIHPALGCATWTAPNLGDPGGPSVPSLALNEMQAAAFQAAPIALVPRTDPMVLVNGHESQAKTVLYRLGVDQTPAGIRADTASYCSNLTTVGRPRIELDKSFTSAAPSPAGVGSLYDFLVARWEASVAILGCH